MKYTVFKRPNPKQFEYRPLYYNEREEEIKNIQERYANPDEARRRELFRDRLQKRWDIHRSHKTEKSKTSSPRLVFYLFIIAILVYFLFFKQVF